MVLLNDPAVTSEAIVVWTGRGRTAWPARDEALLVERFGEDAANLLPVVKRLAHEFYESDAKHVAVDLKAMGGQAAEEFRSRHPEISQEAVEALAWCYTWDHK